MRRPLATVMVIGVMAAVGALVAPNALAAPRLLQVSPKQVNFGSQPVGSLTFAGVTVTNTSSVSLLVLVDAVQLPDDFNFGNLAGSTCIALEGQVLARRARAVWRWSASSLRSSSLATSRRQPCW